jgi:anti-anti-sigma factor
MNLNIISYDGIEIVEFEGEIDLYLVHDLKEKIDILLKQDITKIILDLQNVPRIDSSGIGLLFNICATLSKKKCKPRIIISDSLKYLFKYFSLDEKAVIINSRPVAIDSFNDK